MYEVLGILFWVVNKNPHRTKTEKITAEFSQHIGLRWACYHLCISRIHVNCLCCFCVSEPGYDAEYCI